MVLENGLGLKSRESHVRETKSKARSNRYERSAYFALCSSCFWCASFISKAGSERQIIKNCLTCNKSIEYIPICNNESYMIEQNPSRGIVLQFALR